MSMMASKLPPGPPMIRTWRLPSSFVTLALAIEMPDPDQFSVDTSGGGRVAGDDGEEVATDGVRGGHVEGDRLGTGRNGVGSGDSTGVLVAGPSLTLITRVELAANVPSFGKPALRESNTRTGAIGWNDPAAAGPASRCHLLAA